MKKSLTDAALRKRLNDSGWMEISAGVWAHTQENIISDQKDWGDGDGAKNMDFSTDDYWIITDTGDVSPATLSEIAQMLRQNT